MSAPGLQQLTPKPQSRWSSGGEFIEKRCNACGEVKPLSEFHRKKKARDGLHGICKPCSIVAVRRNRELRRSAIGDEALRANEAERVRRSRERTGNVAGKAYDAARRAATKALRERHPDEYARLFEMAKRGEL